MIFSPFVVGYLLLLLLLFSLSILANYFLCRCVIFAAIAAGTTQPTTFTTTSTSSTGWSCPRGGQCTSATSVARSCTPSFSSRYSGHHFCASQWERSLPKAHFKHDWVCHQMNGWPLRARLCSCPEISLESNSVQAPQRSFRWDYKLRSPMSICMQKYHVCTLKIL